MDVVAKIQSLYLPIVQSILCLTPDLARHVVERPECFSYPLTILALLEKLDISSAYTELEGTPSVARLFKKEAGLNIRELIGFPALDRRRP